jgi:hypothetical protein
VKSPLRRPGLISRPFLIGLALFLVFGTAAVHRQRIYIQNMKPYRPYISNNLIPGQRSAEMVRVLALGWDEMAAVFIWLRSIQDFGGQFRDPFALESLANAFWAMAALDPLFTAMYDFGALVIGDEGGSLDLWAPRVGGSSDFGPTLETMEQAQAAATRMREEAMRFHEAGIENDPDHYRHAYNAVYTCLHGFRTTARAIPYAEVATTRPDCPAWVEGTIPYLKGRSGEYRVALSLWFSQLREDISNQEPALMGIRLRKIIMDGVNPWNARILSDAMDLWAEMHGGDLPNSLEQLLEEGYLRNSRDDLEPILAQWRTGHGGEDPPDLLSAIEAYETAHPGELLEPLRFFNHMRFWADVDRLIATATPFAPIDEERVGLSRYLTVEGQIPPCPLESWASRSNDQMTLAQAVITGGFTYAIDRRERRVVDSGRLLEDTARELLHIRGLIDVHREEHGQWPENLAVLFEALGAEEPVERATGEHFAYDSSEGIARSIAFPHEAMVFRPGEGIPVPAVLGGVRPLDDT